MYIILDIGTFLCCMLKECLTALQICDQPVTYQSMSVGATFFAIFNNLSVGRDNFAKHISAANNENELASQMIWFCSFTTIQQLILLRTIIFWREKPFVFKIKNRPKQNTQIVLRSNVFWSSSNI